MFVRAIVKVPADITYGPLPRRLHRAIHRQLGAEYPRGKKLQGVWCWQELEAAERHGVRVIRVLETWVHLAGDQQPLLPWWRAIEQGRAMPGLAGLLAKTTGNALWGRFAMDSKNYGVRSIRSAGKSGRLVARPFAFRGGRPPSHDLAETVSGRCRAKLFDAIMLAGDGLLSAHTDGIWCRTDPELLAGLPAWRRKQEARRIELLDPQVLRYWPKRGKAQTVYAGYPASLADEAFEARWAREFPKAAA